MLIPKIKLPEMAGLPNESGSPAYSEALARTVPQLMQEQGIGYEPVGTVNWPDAYPYQPQVEVALAHIGTHLLVHYRVSENCLRALADGDGGRVWEDSCCELFLQPEAAATPYDDAATPYHHQAATPYYNIECNCAGTLLLAVGEDRHQRQPASSAVMQGVGRWSSLGRRVISLTDGPACWQLALAIPASALFASGLSDFSRQTMRGNVYKCGDCLSTPHFLSLFPIRTETPDFHRPEFFKTFVFE